ncbi:hypothetical protein PV325_003908 [Microctonus aethiopoides]|uniref:Ubiquitin-like protease family profile domain-containing protein n=1 Tax=Microctonus aethiopoides TaxID=144406 RepID=A0AA39FN79_9HYME|nr:hypothetical protein PV325_003908 [Microctonus aethiopoides]KAK0172732.1 hypothetical protein PV328_006012 [Microctonus aethiopoides]
MTSLDKAGRTAAANMDSHCRSDSSAIAGSIEEHPNMMRQMSCDDDVALSYHDCLLRNSDVKLLNGPYWLNDAVIGFYFEYLEKSIETECQYQIKFASPELTQLLKMLESNDYPAILNSTITNETDFIFFPLNNCDKVDDVGGSHWSLLIYSRAEKSCFHFDSFHGSNDTQAKIFAGKIMQYLLDMKSTNYKEISCPQQNNSYDCGIFVLCYAKIVLQHLKSHSKVEGCDLREVKSMANTKRSELLEIIKKLNK